MAKNTRLAQYILPSAGGLCVTYLYNIVDGIFVGQGVGHQALAAVNITVPFITTLVAISSLFAMEMCIRDRYQPVSASRGTRVRQRHLSALLRRGS